MRAKLMAFMMVMAFAGTSWSAETAKLSVKDSTGTNDVFVVTDAGKVGIGDVTTMTGGLPVGGFHAKSTSIAIAQFLSHTDGVTTAQGGGGFACLHNNAQSALPNKGDRLGYYYFGSQDGGTRRVPVGFTARAEDTWVSNTTYPTYLSIETTPPNSASRIERVRVTSGGFVGIAATAPTQRLEVNGGVRLNTTTTRPVCDANSRGTLWFTKGAATVADKLDVCAKDNTDAYDWRKIY